MKKVIFALSTLMLASVVWATTNPTEALINRIQSSTQVCVAGQDCSAEGMAMASASASSSSRSGQEVYQASCAACHNSGAAGAPRLGAGEWATRLDEKGMDTLVTHTIDGYNAMPPRGGCSDCSDDEIADAVQHIIDDSV